MLVLIKKQYKVGVGNAYESEVLQLSNLLRS
jgi:hypothetical protein